MMGQVEIPNKSSFKINEVCALTGIKSYVLRFWESEFPEIAPLSSSSGQKLYEYKDIEAILTIKKLLFEDKQTIEQAKARMHNLLPRESLVEESFSEDDLYAPMRTPYDQQEEIIPSNFITEQRPGGHIHAPANSHARESMTKRVLIESDFQKLMLAKNKLAEILEIAQKVELKHNWR
jgi:DNA-binding transcriptional MerR regulator